MPKKDIKKITKPEKIYWKFDEDSGDEGELTTNTPEWSKKDSTPHKEIKYEPHPATGLMEWLDS